MAKNEAETDESTDAAVPEKKSKKNLIIIVVAVLVLGLVTAKMTVLKPKPLTAAEQEVKKKADEDALHDKCAAANGLPLLNPKIEHEPVSVENKVLTPNDSSVTVNLSDGAYLKVGIALQLDAGVEPKEAKEGGLGDRATDLTLKALAKHTMEGLAPPAARNKVQQQLSFDVCEAYEGKILSVYFTEFVMQGV